MPGAEHRPGAGADGRRAVVDLGRPLAVHVVGVGGSGMSAIAEVLAAMGHRVSGSDLRPSPVLDRLQAGGARVAVGHDGAAIGDADVVAVSTAIPASNPEVVAAEAAGIPVLGRAEILTAITRLRRTVAVAGTHGKTTTSAMLAVMLAGAGLRPSYVVGGEIGDLGTGARWDQGEWLVVEADESDGTFLELAAELALVTSVEPDHLDHHGGVPALEAAFDRFVAGATAGALVCADDPVAARLGHARGAGSYGFDAGADRLHIAGFSGARTGSRFRAEREGAALGDVDVPMPGAHNARNAAGALAAAMHVGAPFAAAVTALARFGGVARRFQRRGERDGVTFVDDYAHLPGEVRAALAAAADGGWDRVVCVFQPHRFSRTAALWADFAGAFDGADLVAVTELYPAGEAPRPGVSGRLVADAVAAARPGPPVAWLPARAELVAFLRTELRAGDLCLTLGAGDLTTLADELLAP